MVKSQISVFILIGIAVTLLMAFSVFVITSSDISESQNYIFSQDFFLPAKQYFPSCLTEALAETIYHFGSQSLDAVFRSSVENCASDVFQYEYNITRYTASFDNPAESDLLFGVVTFTLDVFVGDLVFTETFEYTPYFSFISDVEIETNLDGFVLTDTFLVSSDSHVSVRIPAGTLIFYQGESIINPVLTVVLHKSNFRYTSPGTNLYYFYPEGISFSEYVPEIIFSADERAAHFMNLGASTNLFWSAASGSEILPVVYDPSSQKFISELRHFSSGQLVISSSASWNEASCSYGGSVSLSQPLRYDQNWVIELTGNFQKGSDNRFFNSGSSSTLRDDLDWFVRNDLLAMQLFRGVSANQQIIFMQTPDSVGSISNPPPTDHWAQTTSVWSLLENGVHTLRVEYDYDQKRYRSFLNGQKILDMPFEVNVIPSPITQLNCIGFSGTIKSVSDQIVPSDVNTGSDSLAAPTKYYIANLNNESNAPAFFINNACVSCSDWMSESECNHFKSHVSAGRFYSSQLIPDNPIYGYPLVSSSIGHYFFWGGFGPDSRNHQSALADFDGDGIDDFLVYWYYTDDSEKKGRWFIIFSKYGVEVPSHLESITDRVRITSLSHIDGTPVNTRHQVLGSDTIATKGNIVPGDYDGDGKVDLALYYDGDWLIHLSSTSQVISKNWGYAGAIPVPGDYSGDGADDLAVYDDGKWYVQSISGDVLLWEHEWGYAGAIPVPGDYSGDGIYDLAVYDTGKWYVQSISGDVLLWEHEWGYAGAIPVSGDISNNNKSDLIVVSDGIWYAQSFSNISDTSTAHVDLWEYRLGNSRDIRPEQCIINLANEVAASVSCVGDTCHLPVLERGEGFLYKPVGGEGRRPWDLVLLPARMRPGGQTPVNRVVFARDPAGETAFKELSYRGNFGPRPKWRWSPKGNQGGSNFYVVAFFVDGSPPQPYLITNGGQRQE